MKNFNSNTDNNDEWLTPPKIISALGVFDLDPCAPVNRPWDTARRHYTKMDDGLKMPWEGRVWLNPPYGRQTFLWIERLRVHKSGVALIFARTETIGFHKSIWEHADAVFFFKGRLRFFDSGGKQGGTANAPSCLVSYSTADTNTIEAAIKSDTLKGKLVYI